MQTPGQREVAVRIEVLLAALAGYVDHVLDTVGHRLVGSHGRIAEALRRRRVEASEGTRFAERLLGLHLGAAQYEKGQAFVDGVVERAGEDGLARLWKSERELPTPAELEAPGLWLARIDLRLAGGPRAGPDAVGALPTLPGVAVGGRGYGTQVGEAGEAQADAGSGSRAGRGWGGLRV